MLIYTCLVWMSLKIMKFNKWCIQIRLSWKGQFFVISSSFGPNSFKHLTYSFYPFSFQVTLSWYIPKKISTHMNNYEVFTCLAKLRESASWFQMIISSHYWHWQILKSNFNNFPTCMTVMKVYPSGSCWQDLQFFLMKLKSACFSRQRNKFFHSFIHLKSETA